MLIVLCRPGQSKVTWKSVGETRGWQSSTRIVRDKLESIKQKIDRLTDG